ncbi:flagellar biosynthetic protein FliR [Variovorax terrae]|uniref:Flagellar biosynthetic protein FliR n=1 Tax=Variovorax terrae TaxID=2923278 RepID=A0A9X2ANM6_9BURK|nr:flagellar biosynthetic protein FliR [Variovorax terrae]MCJ0764554.1 flagellar biosynthetic protein FliR [Variovorax terrae]
MNALTSTFDVATQAAWQNVIASNTNLLLLSIRVATTLALTPVLYAISMPATARVVLILTLSVTLAAGMGPADPTAQVRPELGSLTVAALRELALGATLGLGILLAFGAFAMAGQLLDIQIGFGVAQVFDPVSRRQASVLTSGFQQLGVLVFFLLNGHHALLRGLAYSAERFVPGRSWGLEAAVAVTVPQVGALFALGFALVAPVVFFILLTELALGVVARNLPQMNMFTMGIPVKILVGLVALSLWSTGLGAVMDRVYAGIARSWQTIFTSQAAHKGGVLFCCGTLVLDRQEG